MYHNCRKTHLVRWLFHLAYHLEVLWKTRKIAVLSVGYVAVVFQVWTARKTRQGIGQKAAKRWPSPSLPRSFESAPLTARPFRIISSLAKRKGKRHWSDFYEGYIISDCVVFRLDFVDIAVRSYGKTGSMVDDPSYGILFPFLTQ